MNKSESTTFLQIYERLSAWPPDELILELRQENKTVWEHASKEITRKGYDTTGYQYQFEVNALNEIVGMENWGMDYKVLKETEGVFSSGQKWWEITVETEVWIAILIPKETTMPDGVKISCSDGLKTRISRKCAGGHRSGMHADALKGAITNGFKKTVALFGLGRKAYEGTIDEDYRGIPTEEQQKAKQERKEERKGLKKEWIESQKKIDGNVPKEAFSKPPPIEDMGVPPWDDPVDLTPLEGTYHRVPEKTTRNLPLKMAEKPKAEQSQDLTKALDYLQRLGYSINGIQDAGEAWLLVESGLKTGKRWAVWKECLKLADDNQLNDLVMADIMDALGVETDKGGKPKGVGLLELHKVLEGMKKSLCRYANGKIMWEIPPS